jgi:putative ABC transport system permease protein
MGVFAVIFLFYTKSFLARRRNKEFGLYHILGMNKGNIGRILCWETGMVAAISLGFGLGLGILFSKLAELIVVRILGNQVTYIFTVSLAGIRDTLLVFLAIYVAELLVSLVRVWRTDPLALLRSDRVGEKPPKANWFFALLGVAILAGAYYLAVSIEEPITAILWFFVAVVMVIVATYLLFVAGSVALCKLLQKTKAYYYKPNHFVSVSTMAYRMKRNGAGLASICILCTMVLVMLSSTTSLYLGGENSVRKIYPYGFEFHIYLPDIEANNQTDIDIWRSYVEEAANGSAIDQIDYTLLYTYGMENKDGTVTLDSDVVNSNTLNYDNLRTFYILSLEDYNRITGESVTLERGEALFCSNGTAYTKDTITLQGAEPLTLVPIDTMPEVFQSSDVAVTLYTLVVPNFAEYADWIRPWSDLAWYDSFNVAEDAFDENSDLVAEYLSYNGDLVDWDSLTVGQKVNKLERYILHDKIGEDPVYGTYGYGTDSYSEARRDFICTYGSLFFLGILLSVSFLMGAVLIMYYKQVSEGYEDQNRFAILQKVGMTQREIKRSINTQVVVVFFAPLLLAGLHLAFAFPLIGRMIKLLGMYDGSLLVGVNVAGFLCFGLFYAAVYKITSEVYFRLVSQ